MDDDRAVTIRRDLRGAPPDPVTIDALARLQLAAGRCACRVVCLNASRELLELAEFMGLTHVIASRRLPLEPVGKAEQRTQPLGVEEEHELDDPSP